MSIKNMLIWSSVGLSAVSVLSPSQSAVEQTCCLPDNASEQFCYIGTLDLKSKNPEVQKFSLYYDGVKVHVNNGVYCFKENKDVEKLHVLFINPDALCSVAKKNGDNTIDHLTFVSSAPYHFYSLKRFESSKTTYSWHIKRKPMPKKEVDGHLVVVIPDHTLIIPLDNQFFKKNNNQRSILFSYRALKSEGSIIKLPTPVISEYNKEELQEALLKANICMIHLSNIHAKQEIREIQLDKHRLMQ